MVRFREGAEPRMGGLLHVLSGNACGVWVCLSSWIHTSPQLHINEQAQLLHNFSCSVKVLYIRVTLQLPSPLTML